MKFNELENKLEGIELSKAEYYIKKQLIKEPKSTKLLGLLGIAMHKKGNIEGAIKCYRQCLQGKSHLNREIIDFLSQDLLIKQYWAEGWILFEQRKSRRYWQIEQLSKHLGEKWNEDIGNSCEILLLAEQCYGDTIQFIRYAIKLREFGFKVIVYCQPALVNLIKQQASSELEVTDSITIINAANETLFFGLKNPGESNEEAYERWQSTSPIGITKAIKWFPLMSLARVFQKIGLQFTLNKGYLINCKSKTEYWNRIVKKGQKELLIGLHWQGNPNHEISTYSNFGRSMNFKHWLSLKDLKGLNFISLQKGAGSEQLEMHRGLKINDGQKLFSESYDFQDTAAVILLCDLVLTNDTSIAHLAGALNKPAWILLSKIPEWRWGLSDPNSLWYESLKLFRQKEQGDWQSVIQEIKIRLREKISLMI